MKVQLKMIVISCLALFLSGCGNTEKTNTKAMSRNKTTVSRYMEAFNETDHAAILSCLTEDVVWELPGVYRHKGKAAFDKEIENEGFTGKPVIKVTRMSEEGNIVVAEGTVLATTKDGRKLTIAFCDVFEMENGLIDKLTSYLMTTNTGNL